MPIRHSLIAVLTVVAACDARELTVPEAPGAPPPATPPPPVMPAPLPAMPATPQTRGPWTDPPPAAPAAAPSPAPSPAAAYDPASGLFVVHEWGTMTSVSASDGSPLPGLHHEEEDLPGFVADRMAQALVTPGIVAQHAADKLETPVTYFYSPQPRQVAVRAGFPAGIFTQWFPYVRNTTPSLDSYRSVGTVDGWISTSAMIPNSCRPRFEAGFKNGMLDWGAVEVLPREMSVPLPGPLGATSWGFARRTSANAVRVSIGGRNYDERFLFYRGLGSVSMPVTVRSVGGDALVLSNRDGFLDMRSAFLLQVTRTSAGFRALGDLPAGKEVTADLPRPELPLDRYVAELKQALAAALVGDGLYADEAQAMVDTWERSYFLTPGPRLLYLLPQQRTDAILPLTISPQPDHVGRTMVIRTEIVTAAQEQRLAAELSGLASPQPADRTAARAYFLGLGRFAEPHLSRALALTASAVERGAGLALLGEVQSKRRWAPASAE
jgi:hypothetical protein